MADISKITLPSGTTYNLKDASARSTIAALNSAIIFRGVTTTALSDGATTNPITIGTTQLTAKNGDVVMYGTSEFIFASSDNKWHEFGSTSELKALAFKASASGSYTPAGSVSKPTFTGTKATISVKHTPAGSVTIGTGTGTANYTPAGSVSKPTITVTPNTATIKQFDSQGTLPSWTASVASETLTIGWSAGTLPSGADVSVATGIKSATSSQPSFTGTAVQLTGSFSGTEATCSAEYTPAGSVSQPTFSGTAATISVS